MSLALIIEDGSRVPGANSYVTLDEANAYLAYHAQRVAWASLTDDGKAAAIVQATRALDAGCAWKGQQVDVNQARAWPRYGVIIEGGAGMAWEPMRSRYMGGVGDNEVPLRVKEASMELAALMMAGDRTADPDSAGIKSVGLGDKALDIVFDAATMPKMLGKIVPLMLSEYTNGGGRGMVPVVRSYNAIP